MGRMHARRKGKASSKKPLSTTAPSWMKLKKDEIEALITKLAKQDKQSSEIGLILRDSYGVPDVKILTGKNISQILKEKKLNPEIPEELQNLIKRAVMVRKHMSSNKKDMVSKRGLQLIESKIRRLEKYYKSRNVLPKTWKYNPERARLLVG
jgi:small subunit ribosomal protein S15